jgi:predicted small metal-binding protein
LSNKPATQGEVAVHKVLRCECGYLAEADDEDELVRIAQQHAHDVHHMAMSAEQVLFAVLRDELDRPDGWADHK